MDRRAPIYAAPDYWGQSASRVMDTKGLRPLAADRIIGFVEPIFIFHGVRSLTWRSASKMGGEKGNRKLDGVVFGTPPRAYESRRRAHFHISWCQVTDMDICLENGR